MKRLTALATLLFAMIMLVSAQDKSKILEMTGTHDNLGLEDT